MKKVITSQKDCTKKEWEAIMKSRRSVVGLGQNLGTRTHGSRGRKKERIQGKKECFRAGQSCPDFLYV